MTDEYEVAEVYEGLRGQALALTPEQLGIVESRENKALAVLMEVGLEQGVATLVAVNDGSASLYFSNGGGVIGAGRDPDVASASRLMIARAENAIALMQPVIEYPLPRSGHVRFYVVTPGGIYTAEQIESALAEGHDRLAVIWQQGQQLLAAIRAAETADPE